MKKYNLSLLIIVAITAMRCIKITPAPQLPSITTTGANTFGCLVNGNIWLPQSTISGGGIYALWVTGPANGSYKQNEAVSIYADNRTQNGESNSNLELDLVRLTDTGTYKIYNSLSVGMTYSDGTIDYAPVDTFGTIKILRLDTIADIVSGTFSFRGTNTQFNKTVYITNGRFDVHWPYKQ